ncbi:hypothetical protein M8J71_11010 [Pseudarthrobacter sp. R1]|uniref:hypothetical protein n=1 Tax=Pseudarthrobacter sp. R1 TaxID=2944934 RepID=UPI002108F43B|nr:hypothetical protein [Pseudarthrobacter sp. R1]MCQ6271012.1 hypothetical protein [Pseudarthrobacter sp. R1]
MRLVAGSALFYAAGIAAIASKRYGLLVRLFRLKRPHAYSDSDQLLSDALEADRALENTPPRLLSFLAPLLADSLSLGQERIDEAWQLFEVLRISAVLFASPSYGRLSRIFEYADDGSVKAEEAHKSAEQDGKVVGEARVAWQKAAEGRRQALENLANLAPVHGAHLYVVERRLDHWHIPVAERLAKELDAEGEAHPLAQAWSSHDAKELAAAIRAVSTAAGRSADRLSWKGIGPGGGIIPSEILLDSRT